MQQKRVNDDRVVLHHEAARKWLCFKSPRQIIATHRLGEVLDALGRVEELVNREGWFAAGFLSYESSGAFDSALSTRSQNELPLLWFGLFPEPEEVTLPAPDWDQYALGKFEPSVSQSEYARAIRAVRSHIHAGDTYQVNYTLRLRVPFKGDPWNLFLALVRAQSPGYSAWIDAERFAVCSASPELFFSLKGNQLLCKPMKGTVKRGRTLEEDMALADWLQHSEKNRAENVMITDMIRNDLGRIAEFGSVHVPGLFEVERHPTLWQMTSTVAAFCSKPVTEIFKALFPCASITGAPKVRTTQIITDLENSPRGIYTGCIGFIAPERLAQFNVAIRTAIVDRHKSQLEYGTGGGIVWDSTSEDEYTEALLKTRVLTERYPEFSLLETMLWTPEDQYFLIDEHMNRLSRSATYFNFSLNLEDVESRLENLAGSFGRTPHRVRLLVSRTGEVHVEAKALDVSGNKRPFRIGLAQSPVNSANIFLYHKTTRRRVYEDARKGCAECDDVLLWNEREEVTESCLANIVFDIDGELCTPPVKSGLLAGTFRERLLAEGRIRERLLPVAGLKQCRKLYLINSVRKWQDAALI